MEQLSYEFVKMSNDKLPVKILHNYTNESYKGCVLHWHEQLEFYYVISGGVFILCNGRQGWLKEGEIGCINWCEPHRGARFLDNTEHYIIQIDLEKLLESSSFSPGSVYLRYIPTFLGRDSVLAAFFQEIIQEYFKQEEGYELQIYGTLWHILSYLLRSFMLADKDKTEDNPSGITLELTKKILFFIASHYKDKLTLKQIAEEAGLSESYMCRIFKKHTGFTVLDYRNEIRCERAAVFISNGVPVNEAGFLVGFDDYNYFSRMFRRKRGISPVNYKKTL
ncbi:helix-turn-helix domain-containing protein [Anaerocolumna xylanovorans]|uniref:AraC-type DNA-binding protein n=1 Tax=Anaerocolumna xylanovorans DSM 12503 TaxID=1121345 RepID=A0A1M7Y868_9FIRM|nr:AraC family transcriptional regulator [Anaerocolumna xylanovorans]SHO48835.1 AraC-type DNA-binding protein [Anaerocolumna xylanovorans DSM 12503]